MTQVLLGLATAIGLSGTANKIPFEQARERARLDLQRTSQYYYAVDLQENAFRNLELNIWNASSGLQIGQIQASKLIEQARLRLIFRTDDDISLVMPLSRNLRALPGVFYVKSSRQTDGWSCGHWSVCNAKAIDQLLLDGREINSESLREMASRFRAEQIDFRVQRRLESEEVGNLARNLQLNNYSVQGIFNRAIQFNAEADEALRNAFLGNKLHQLQFDVGGDDAGAGLANRIVPAFLASQGPLYLDFIIAQTGLRDGVGVDDNVRVAAAQRIDDAAYNLQLNRLSFFPILQEDFRAKVQANQTAAIHFSCHVPGHWILISIVNLPHLNRPVMILQDSVESHIDRYFAYINFLHRTFIQNEPLA